MTKTELKYLQYHMVLHFNSFIRTKNTWVDEKSIEMILHTSTNTNGQIEALKHLNHYTRQHTKTGTEDPY